MSIARANLKHLYQHRAILCLFAFLALVCAGVAGSAFRGENGGAILGVWLVVFYAGLFGAAPQVAILAKPFSYCLPGHRRVPGRILSWTCIVVSLIPSAAIHFLSVSGSSPSQFVALFASNTIAYWLGVWVTFGARNWTAAIGLFGFVPLISIYTRDSTAIGRFMSDSWVMIVLLGIGASYCARTRLSRDGLARRYCGKLVMGAFDAWNKDKLTKLQEVRRQEREERKKGRDCLSPTVERFFLARISDRQMGDTAKHIWSGIYRSWAVSASTRPWAFLVWLPLLVVFMCYMGAAGGILYVFPAVMVIHMSLHVQSSLLTTGGRRERFYTALVLAVSSSIFFLLVVLLATVTSELLALIMPPLALTGRAMPFTPLNVKLSYMPLLVVPLVLTGRLLFRRQTALSKIAPAIAIMVFFQLFVAMGIADQRIHITPAMIVVAIALMWTGFVLLLSLVCRRRCLTQ